MYRRIAAASCGLALLVALFVAAVHKHGSSSTSAQENAGCLYCSGGNVAAQAPKIAPAARRISRMPEATVPRSPAMPWRLPLDHSGSAPPA